MAALSPDHREALAPAAQLLLPALAARPWAADFYLAGSAALALYTGHRPVRDLDLMSGTCRLTPPERRDLLADLLAAEPAVRVETARDGYLFVRFADQVAARYFYYPYPLIDPLAEVGGLAVVSAVDLGLMKLAAIISRGSRRDFVDLYLLCRELPIETLLARAEEKFGHVGDFVLQALKGLADLLIERLAEVATPRGSTPRAGAAQGAVARLPGAEILVQGGRIAFVGPPAERERRFGALPETPRLDGRGGTAIPGFVDPHTHLPWGGDRAEEFARRLAGVSYQEIAAAGGGILATVRATRGASEEELADAMRPRLARMLAGGTTTAEAKSGYGLTLADEVKQLAAIRRAGAAQPVELVPTLLAAHEVPPEHRSARERYLDLICEEIVPAVAEAGLARYCDVFCEAGVFSAAESRRVLAAGRAHGLLPRLHADEFADSGGAELAAELAALSADHLMAVSDRGIEALAASGVTAVLLPGTSFFLMQHVFAPARRLIAAGVPVALATDCNPGSCNTESMPTIVTLAVFELRLSVEEALTAATLNAACTLGLGAEVGSLEEGKRADVVVLDAPNLFHLAYHFGVNPVAAVVKGGRVVHRASLPGLG